MTPTAELARLARHREIWAARPELRAVYREWFVAILAVVGDRTPAVELGTGPGFFKEYAPGLVALDILPSPWVDLVADGGALPLRTGSMGAIVMIDTLHHLSTPLRFLDEAVRSLRIGGRLAMIEPWITPCSWLLYRFLHHEECRLGIDLERPFAADTKRALDGNAAIPLQWLKHVSAAEDRLRLVRAETFVGLPYLATFGFKRTRPVPQLLIRLARALERVVDPARALAASRVLAVWERVPPPTVMSR